MKNEQRIKYIKMSDWDLKKQQAKIEFEEWLIINKQSKFIKILERIKSWLKQTDQKLKRKEYF